MCRCAGQSHVQHTSRQRRSSHCSMNTTVHALRKALTATDAVARSGAHARQQAKKTASPLVPSSHGRRSFLLVHLSGMSTKPCNCISQHQWCPVERPAAGLSGRQFLARYRTNISALKPFVTLSTCSQSRGKYMCSSSMCDAAQCH